MSARRAAVDVGTNSCRLLVIEEDGTPVTREMRITRLGAGVDETGHLDDEALERTLATIEDYRDRWRDLGVEQVRIAATSAVRDASDRERFLEGVRHRTGVEPEVLTGEEEAAATFRGATGQLDAASPTVVLDVGGGSTELIVGDERGQLAGSVSLQLGSVRLTERLLPSDPPTADEVAAARDEVRARIGEGRERLASDAADPADAAALIGVAGTVTTLAALHLDLDRYDPEQVHGTRMSRADVDRICDHLLDLSSAQRAQLACVAEGREDVIGGGVLIVRGVMELLDASELIASEADILDGLVL